MCTLCSKLLTCGAVIALLLAITAPVVAQEGTPTPEPWPTPIVSDTYVVKQEVTYGEGGIIVALLFTSGVVLLQLMVHLGERVTDR